MKSSKIVQWFYKPYPLNFTVYNRILTILSFSFFVFLYTYVFRPFEFSAYVDVFFASVSYAFITSLVSTFYLFVIPKFVPSFFDKEKWTTGKMSFFIFLTALTIGFCSYLYSFNLQLRNGFNYVSLPLFLFYTLLIGVFPILIHVMIYENVSRKINEKTAKEVTKSINNPPCNAGQKTITITETNNKNSIRINAKDLIYLRAQGNYVSFYLNKINHKIEEKVLRISLSKVEKLLVKECHSFVKCHRSYIINSYHFKKITGNARSYTLESPVLKHAIPVSRSFPKEKLNSLISSLQ